MVQTVKNLLVMQETRLRFPGQEDPLEKRTATHSSILALKYSSEDDAFASSKGSLLLQAKLLALPQKLVCVPFFTSAFSPYIMCPSLIGCSGGEKGCQEIKLE